MLGKVLSLNLQKGGVSKTTSCIAIAYLLSNKFKKKVLLIDMDSQASATKILTQRSPYDFKGRTILEAIQKEEHTEHIFSIAENFDLICSNAFLSTLPAFLYTTYARWGRKPYEALKYVINDLKDQYDIILIDTPPSLGDATLNSLYTSDYAIIPCETSMMAFQELEAQLELIDVVKKAGNSDLKLLGILANIIDVRRKKDNKEFFDGIEMYYPNLMFKTIITRNAEMSRIANEDIFQNKKLIKTLEQQYLPLLKELKEYGIYT